MNKVYVNSPANIFAAWALAVADLAGVPVQVVVLDKAQQNEKDFKAKNPTGLFPLLETADGTILFESAAIAAHFARHAPTSGLLGQTPFQQAKVDEWIAWIQGNVATALRPVVMPAFTGSDKSADAEKKLLGHIKTVNDYLEDGEKSFLVGDNLTIADIALAALLSIPYQVCWGAEFFDKYETTADYLERIVGLPSFVRRFGYIKRNGYVAAEAAPAAGQTASAPAKKADADIDEDDLFGDDDDAPAPVKVEVKKKKKEVIAMSLVMLEVKPLDSETNLDDLAKKIFNEVTQDGLFWKTEYKKEPVAFGIFKLVIGFSCEDEKVSVDAIVEKIEELEDFVQSVEIMAFNKI